MADDLTIKLTSRERELILEYGYPFDGIEDQLRDSCSKRGRVEVRDAAYWWEQVVGNVSISVNEDVEDADLVEELDELCGTIESHLEIHNARVSKKLDA